MIRRAKRPGGGYVVIQNIVARDARLTLRARGLLLLMLSYPDNWDFDSKRLAEHLREGRDAIRAALTELEAAGYIIRRRIHVGGRFDWDLTIYDTPQVSPGHDMAGFSGHGGGEADTMAGFQGPENPAMVRAGEMPGHDMAGFSGPDNPASIERPSTKTVKKEDRPLATLAPPSRAEALPGMPEPEPTASRPQTGPTPNPDEDFEIFWKIYPRKVGKQEARKVWLRKVKGTLPSKIIEGAERFANDPNREQEFTPHPSTWLNQGRWEDEPLPARSTGRAGRPSTNDRVRAGLELTSQFRAEREQGEAHRLPVVWQRPGQTRQREIEGSW